MHTFHFVITITFLLVVNAVNPSRPNFQPNTRYCTVNTDCPDSYMYCGKNDGDCTGQGFCVPTSEFCPMDYNPVCGCDGQTYSNKCFAHSAGVNIASKGACKLPVPCNINSDCKGGSNSFCSRPAGKCGQTGLCLEIPSNCPESLLPVCGCDGKTYSNECLAQQSSVSVAYVGFCKNSGSCSLNSDCASGSFCARKSCDGSGTCTVKPQFCPAIYSPVCGCDGNTYSNECSANSRGVSVNYTGECVTTKTCKSKKDCVGQNFCSRPDGQCGNAGTCDRMPDFCGRNYDPVCGCDGKSYSNACLASVNGTSVNYRGMCGVNKVCTGSSQCNASQYCAQDVGSCLMGTGNCEQKPTICPRNFDPVCGCDGKTYSNACTAASRGVNVNFRGSCEDSQ